MIRRAPETVCAAGRQLLRLDGQPYEGVDFSSPCPRSGIYPVNVQHFGEISLCFCHFAALAASGVLGDSPLD